MSNYTQSYNSKGKNYEPDEINIAKAMFENFGTSKFINEPYELSLSILKYPEVVVRVIRKYGRKFSETNYRPTVEDIKRVYWDRVNPQQHKTGIEKCSACEGKGFFSAVSRRDGSLIPRNTPPFPARGLAEVVIACGCSNGETTDEKEDKSIRNNRVRKYGHRSSFIVNVFIWACRDLAEQTAENA